MPIRFAAARRGDSSLCRFLGARAPSAAANDNLAGGDDDRMLRAALHHFAAHGLGAAKAALARAETAYLADDGAEYLWWLGICRMLDRRMADAVMMARREPPKG